MSTRLYRHDVFFLILLRLDFQTVGVDMVVVVVVAGGFMKLNDKKQIWISSNRVSFL